MTEPVNRQARFAELYKQGMELLLENRDDEAMKLFWEAANIAPEGWLALSNELIKDKQYGPAEDRCKELLQITKDAKIRAAALNNLGMIYCAIGQVDSAEQTFRESLKEYPSSPDAYSNLGLIHQWKHSFDESIRWAARALKIDPWHEQAQFIRSSVKLLKGEYIEGFQEYECRWRSKNNGLSKLNCNVPEWDGRNGKSIFVYGEQGHGDSILMLRYAREIRARGLRQAWVCQRGMAPLLKLVPEIDQIVEVGDNLPDFDCHLPSVSLPRVLGTTLDNIPTTPYIEWPANSIYYGEGFHVGICWRGSTAQTNDQFRSTTLSDWSKVLDVTGVTFHSIQVENSGEVELYPSICTYPKPEDWAETVRRMVGLDLVISVDTAIVHLAGALGIPCWCALHRRPYFVYPPLCGDKTPWYQSVRLFRSEKDHDWPRVFGEIAKELCKLKSKT